MCTFIHWILCNSAGPAPPSWKGVSSCFLDAEFSGSLRHGLSFPVLGSRVALRFEARQLLVGQGGRGGGARGGPRLLNCTSSLYCLSFRHLLFLSLGSKVTANFLAIHHTKDQVTTCSESMRVRALGSPAGAAPLPATPQTGKPDCVGGAGNNTVCCGTAGRGRRREGRPGRPWR